MLLANRNLIITLGLSVIANSAVARSGKNIRTFIPLQKITVGPFDNFQPTVSDDESAIFFTRSQNLSSQIFKIDFKTGLTESVTRSEVDAKSPAISPDGKQLAVTFFGNDAKGDVCLAGKDAVMTCITGSGKGEHSPFWLDNDTLGYVESDDKGSVHKVYTYDLKKKTRSLVLEGQIFGPSMSPQSGMLAYKSTGAEFTIFDVSKKSELRKIPIRLPGTSGLARFSADGEYLYFSQYMLDSNRDLVLDSRDAAAIFRVAVNDKNAIPEQLTSLDQNCSYPTPTKSSLYLTCAFEGALDVYKAPLTGVTPGTWTEADLWQAHEAARSYSDKIMLLNQIRTKSPSLTSGEFDERMFNNFVFMNAWMPAIFYGERLKDSSNDYPAQLILLETFTKWDALPSKENVAELDRLLSNADKKLQALNPSPIRQIVKAHLEFFRNQSKNALQILDETKPSSQIGLYWQTKLYERILSPKSPEKFEVKLSSRVTSDNSGEETRFYYLARLLGQLEKTGNRDQTLTQLEHALKAKNDVVSSKLLELVQNERQLYRVLATEDKTVVRTEMREVVERVKRLKDSYFPLRLLFARSVILLQTNNRPRELSQVMSLWLSYIKPTSKEYPYAIEALRFTSLEAAYKFYNGPEKTRDLAAGSFYSSIRTTDDLEAHYQYALLNQSKDAWSDLLKAYDLMIKDGLVEADSLVFVKTIHDIISSGSKPSDDQLQRASADIDKMSNDLVGVGAKYLFLGYLYHEQYRRTITGIESDRSLAQKAHQSYLFAIDAAFDNSRIQAAALQNLGLLHFSLRNYSMAAEFLQKRQQLPFMGAGQQEAVGWFEAKSLYQSYRAAEAVTVIETILKNPSNHRTALMERQAFYAWNAGQFDKAARLYEAVIPDLGKKANSGIYLSYGYSLMKAGKIASAEVQLKAAIEMAQGEAKVTVGGLNRSPEKIEFTARGLLARLALENQQKISHLNERLRMFPGMINGAKGYYLDKATLKSQQVKETFDLVFLESDANSPDKIRVQTLEKTLKLAYDYGEDQGFLNQTVFNTLKNSMLLHRKNNVYRQATITNHVENLLEKASEEFRDEKMPSSQLRKQWAEIELVTLAYKLGDEKNFASRFKEESDKLMAEANLTELAKERDDLLASIKSYRDLMAKTL
jgi:hypothetical protein